MSFLFIAFLSLFFLVLFSSIVSASPLSEFDRGNVKVGVYSTAGERADLNGVSLNNGGNVRFDAYYAFSDKWAMGLRHKKINVKKRLERTILGQTFGTTVDGDLKESDLLLLYNFSSRNKHKNSPKFYLYTGVKRLEGQLNGKTLTGTVKFFGRTYSGTVYIDPKHKTVYGPSLGFMAVIPVTKTMDAWADLHLMHYINGAELGLSQKVTDNIALDASYFYDKYKYKDYSMTDKGFRFGVTFGLNK